MWIIPILPWVVALEKDVRLPMATISLEMTLMVQYNLSAPTMTHWMIALPTQVKNGIMHDLFHKFIVMFLASATGHGTFVAGIIAAEDKKYVRNFSLLMSPYIMHPFLGLDRSCSRCNIGNVEVSQNDWQGEASLFTFVCY